MKRPRLLAGLLGAALATGPALLVASPAWADGSVVSPGAGTVFDEETTVRVEATVAGRSGAAQLALVDPAGTSHAVGSVQGSLQEQRMSFALDVSCPDYPGASCSGRRPARNGTWTVRLTGGATDSRTFDLRVPPRAPSGVRAEGTSPREVVVTWDGGAEPDLTGYEVLAGDRVVATADPSCPSGGCRAVLTYDTDGPSTEQLSVRVRRAACPDCDSTLSATSPVVEARRPAPPPPPAPEPTVAPTTGSKGASGTGGTASGGSAGGSGGTGAPDGSSGSGTGAGGSTGTGTGTGAGGGTGGSGTTGGTGTGSSGSAGGAGGTGVPADVTTTAPDTTAAADAFALTFKAFGPKIGLPKLPPLPATGVALPAVAPPADGSFEGELPFDEKTVTEQVPTTALGPAQRIQTVVQSAVDSERLVKSVAAALLLLLVCAHLRRWLAQAPEEP